MEELIVLRLCLKDRSSVLIKGNFDDIDKQARESQFIKVINHKTNKEEIYNKDWIWCVRISSENEQDKR